MRKFKLFALLLGLFSLIGFTQIVKAEAQQTLVSVKYQLDNGDPTQVWSGSKTVGSTLEHEASLADSSFMFWTVNGVVRTDLPQNLTIRVTSKLELVAYFATDYTVAFLDANTKLLEVNFVSDGDTLTPPTNEPTRPGSVFLGYAPIQNYEDAVANKTPANPGSKAYLVAKYQVSDVTTNKFTVTIDGVDTNDVPLNTVQEVTGGDVNSVWKNQHDQIVGYGETFEFTVLGNETITKEAGTAKVEYVTFRGPFTLRENHNSYVGRFQLGEKEVVEYGFVLSDETKLQASTLNAQTNEFLGTFASSYNVVGTYVTYLEGTTLTTITSTLPIAKHTVTINGEADTYLVDPEEGPYDLGSTVELYFDKPGYVLDTLTVDGVSVLDDVIDGMYTLTITQDHVVAFTWKKEVPHINELLYSYNFLDGGTSNNSAYANTGLTTEISYATDNPFETTETTDWKADYANLSMTTATRLGGKLVSTEHGSPNANIRTDFKYDKVLTKVEILGASKFGTAGNTTKIFLQTSTDGETWSTIASTTTVTSTISFDDLNIPSGRYIKIVVELEASSTNSGLAFTGIKVYGLTPINPAKQDIDAIEFSETEFDIATDLSLPTIGAVNSSAITWTSTHVEIIDITGVMTLPEHTTKVTLTATATIDDYQFIKEYEINVVGIRTRVSEQLNLIELPGQIDSEHITLPSKTEDGRSDIVWSSDNSAIDPTTGVITRPTDESVSVTLAATVVEGGYTIVREFIVIVVKEGGTVEPEVYTVTITVKSDNPKTGIENGSINKYLVFTQNDGGTAVTTVTYTRTGTDTNTLFNNSANELRIYRTSQLDFEVEGAKITNIEWVSTRNDGISINQGPSVSDNIGSQLFNTPVDNVNIEGTSTGQFRIASIILTYVINPS